MSSPISRLGQWVKGLFGEGAAPSSGQGLLNAVVVGGQAPRRGTRDLLIAYKNIPVIHSVVHRISQDVASVPFRLLRPAGRVPGGAKRYRGTGGSSLVRRAMLQDAVAAGDLVEVDDHPFLDLLQRMNPALRGMPSRAIINVWTELSGEAFLVKERNGLGLPLELWPVPPHWVQEIPHRDFPNFRTSWLGWNRLLPEADVVWLKHPDSDNPYARGTGLGNALADELDVDEFATKHIRNWFHNSAMPSAVVALEGASAAEVKLFQADWEEKFKGSKKSHQMKFTNGKLSVQALTDTFKDQQLVELRKVTKEICRETFCMPPELVGALDNSNRATIDAAYFLYSTGVLCPRLDFLVSNYQPLLEEFDESLLLDYVSPVPEDRDFKQKVMVAVPSVFTVDEHRALAGMPPLPDGEGDELYEPAGLGGFGAAPAEPTPADAPAPPPAPEPPPAEDPAADEPAKSERGRALHPARKDLSTHAIQSILEALRPHRLSDESGPVFKSRLERWGQRVLQELGTEVTFDIRNPMVRQHLEELSGSKITGITDTTREELKSQLAEGASAGEGIDEMSARVGDVFDNAAGYRAEMIARTEVVGSSNFANFEAFKMSGVVAHKEWLSVQGAQTRDEHRELDGTMTMLNEAFQVNGYSSNYPGGFGQAHLDINCRCSVLPVVDDPDKAGSLIHTCSSSEERLATWKRFDMRAASWERVALAAFKRGFRKQQKDVMAALHRWA